ncbi:MAG TPA: response regulator [Steroidobacteraceae bacterium]
MQPADARTHVEQTGPRVLVVDDDPATVELVRSVLAANGYACLTASSAEGALASIRATPDILIVISDINMPRMDGISFLERINAQAGANPPRVIFLTAYPSVDYAVAALRLGALDFLIKPVRPQNLLRVVREAVARVQRERAVSSLPEQAATLARQAEMLANALKGFARPPAPESTTARSALAMPRDPGSQQRDLALLGLEHLRRLRREFPRLSELDDVAWDLLRELLRSEKSGQRLSVSALSVSVEQVSSTTALRRIQELVKAGHIVRSPDPTDARRDFVALADETRATLEQYLERVANELAAVARVSA